MGTVDLFHSRRTMFAECKYWIRDERTSIGNASEWILKNTPSGTFWAREISPQYNQQNQVHNVFMLDKNMITLESDDDLSEISRGCVVLYNGHPWMVDSVQRQIHRKESEFNVDVDYKYIINMRRG